MKHGIWAVVAVLTGIVFCACGGGGDAPVKTEDPAQAAETPETASTGQAADGENEKISGTRAFSMAEDLLEDMTLREKIGQMFIVHLSQIDDAHTGDGSQYHVTKKMRRILRDYNIGGVYLTRSNIGNCRQAEELIEDLQGCVSGGSMYVAVQEEGGERSLCAEVPEWEEPENFSPLRMAGQMSGAEVYSRSLATAEKFSKIGINLNLAPVADVGSDKNASYAERCFGTEPDVVQEYLENFIKGMEDGGVGTTLKFFPGIGGVQGNAEEELLESGDSLMTLRNENFGLYSAGIESGADAVMMSSVAVRKVTVNPIPAFLSEDIVTKLLREELDFSGVIMTPQLDDPVIIEKYTPGFAAVEAVRAGCDMLVLPQDWKESFEALAAAVGRGDIGEKVINTAVQRILQNKIQRGILELD